MKGFALTLHPMDAHEVVVHDPACKSRLAPHLIARDPLGGEIGVHALDGDEGGLAGTSAHVDGCGAAGGDLHQRFVRRGFAGHRRPLSTPYLSSRRTR